MITIVSPTEEFPSARLIQPLGVWYEEFILTMLHLSSAGVFPSWKCLSVVGRVRLRRAREGVRSREANNLIASARFCFWRLSRSNAEIFLVAANEPLCVRSTKLHFTTDLATSFLLLVLL